MIDNFSQLPPIMFVDKVHLQTRCPFFSIEEINSLFMLSSAGKKMHWLYSRITTLPLTILFGLFRVGLAWILRKEGE